MGTTPDGLPYPESSEPANEGALDIQALAVALNDRGGGRMVQTGQTEVTFNAAAGSLVFPKPFKTGTVPVVLAAGGAGSTPNNTLPCVSSEQWSATGCLLHAVRVSGTGAASVWVSNGDVMNVVWIAVGQAP